MTPFILLAFLALPFIEIAVLIAVGSEIGILATLGLIVVSAVAGILIVRAQGLNEVRRMRASVQAGKAPVASMVHAVLLVVAGFCLLIPGFVTDIIGLLLLIPPLRALLGLWFFARLIARVRKGGGSETIIIEGEAWETESPKPPESGERKSIPSTRNPERRRSGPHS